VNNTHLAAEILRDSCRRGDLIFDLNPRRFFLGDNQPDDVDCDAE